jgi:Predicted ATPase
MNVTEYYEKELQTRGYQSDPAQRAAVDRLQRCFEEWTEYKSRRSNAFKKLLIHPDLPRGVYMWAESGGARAS